MDEEIILGEKKYISSRRAGEQFGYASDYVTQLCRGGKIDARRIGQTWFIAEDSLKDHAQKTTPRRPRSGSLPRIETEVIPKSLSESEHQKNDAWESFLLNEVGSIQEYKTENAIPVKHFLRAPILENHYREEHGLRTFPRQITKVIPEIAVERSSRVPLFLWGIITLFLFFLVSFLTIREGTTVYTNNQGDLNLATPANDSTTSWDDIKNFLKLRD